MGRCMGENGDECRLCGVKVATLEGGNAGLDLIVQGGVSRTRSGGRGAQTKQRTPGSQGLYAEASTVSNWANTFGLPATISPLSK